MIKRFVILILFFTLVGVSCTSKSVSQKEKSEKSALLNSNGYFKVSKVVDGDTFWVDDGSEKGVKIRLIGIDAPESRNVFKKKKGYFGPESKAYLKDLLENQLVRLEYDVDSLDQYGRTLAYVFLSDGTFINAELVKNGFAVVMTIPPNFKYVDEFVSLQREAREASRGLWQIEIE